MATCEWMGGWMVCWVGPGFVLKKTFIAYLFWGLVWGVLHYPLDLRLGLNTFSIICRLD